MELLLLRVLTSIIICDMSLLYVILFTFLLLDEDPFILSDKESEDLFTLNIRLSLERASERKLLNNIAIHATRNVMPSYESLKLIVECAGGMVSRYTCYI